MEILYKEIKASTKGVELTNDTDQIVIVCHNENPWHHLRIYTQDQWEDIVAGLHTDQVNPRSINKIIGEPIATFRPNQPITIEHIFLNLVTVNGEPTKNFVYIKDGDRMAQLWDERTAPRDISDHSIGRVRRTGKQN